MNVKTIKTGTLFVVEDNGYDGCHLAVYIGVTPYSGGKMLLLKWLDGKGDMCHVFTSDFSKRFFKVKITKISSINDEESVMMYDSGEPVKGKPEKPSIVINDLRLYYAKMPAV